jgi:hypothetical protein
MTKAAIYLLLALILLQSSLALTDCSSDLCTGKYGNWRAYGMTKYILQNGTDYTFTYDLPRLETQMKGDPTDNKLVMILIAWDSFRGGVDNQTKPDEFVTYISSQQDGSKVIKLNSSVVCPDDWRSLGTCITAIELDKWKPTSEYNVIQNFVINRFGASFLNVREETITISALPVDTIIATQSFAPDLSPDTSNFYLREKVSDTGARVVLIFSGIASLINVIVVIAYWFLKIAILVFGILLPIILIVGIYKFIKKKIEAI